MDLGSGGLHEGDDGPRFRSREELGDELEKLKRGSSYSYNALSRAIDRPASTLHGWISARHLPYSRDNDDFVSMIALLGATDADADELLASVVALRTRGLGRGRNPYKGLDSFTEMDADLFFGREALTAMLVERATGSVLAGLSHPIIVLGASGSGKTSLLRAGLLARLAQQDPALDVAYTTPSNEEWHQHLRSRQWRDGSTKGRVVVLDQFEECFSEGRSDELSQIIACMAEFCTRTDTLLVVGLRSDFFHRAAEVPLLLEGLRDNPVVVGPMTVEEVTRAIVKPAGQSSVDIPPDLLAELILEFGIDRRGVTGANSLPMLSHVLHVLVESAGDGQLSLARYRDTGGLHAAIERSAEVAFADSDKTACRLLFSQLVDIGQDAQPTRRLSELKTLRYLDSEADFEAVIGGFTAHGLLTVDVGSVAISHEALVQAWPRLAGWIDELRASLVSLNWVKSAASTWHRTGREDDALLRGSQLAAAEECLASPTSRSRLSDQDHAFVLASQAAERDRQEEQRNSLSRQLATQSELLRPSDASLSAQIAIVAFVTAATVESRSALLGATSPLPGGRTLGGPGPTWLSASADGRQIAFSNAADDSIRVVDTSDRSGRPARIFGRDHEGGSIGAVALSPDGRILASGGSDRAIRLWDTHADADSAPVILHDDGFAFAGPIHALHFDRRGEQLFAAGVGDGVACWQVGSALQATLRRVIPNPATTLSVCTDDSAELLATASKNGTVAVWSLADPTTPLWSQVTQDHGPASAVALSPDGTLLAAAFHNGRIRAWSLEREPLRVTEVSIPTAPFASWVNSLQFCHCGRLLVAASSDGNVRLWRTTDWTKALPDFRHPTVVASACFVGGRAIATGAEDGALRTWDISAAYEPHNSESIWSIGHDLQGRFRTSASRSRVAIFALDSEGEPKLEREIGPEPDTEFSGASAISPDGELLAIGTRLGPIVLAETADGGSIATLDQLDALVENVTFSHDGSLLCAVDETGGVQVWTLDDGQPPLAASRLEIEPSAMCPAFSGDATLLAVTSESGHTTLIDVATPAHIRKVATVRTGDSFALGVSFHPREPLLAVGNADRSTSIWDCSNPAEPTLIHRLTGPTGHTITVAFNHSGNLLAAGVTNGSVWIWDTTTPAQPQLHAKLDSQEQGVYALGFSPTHNTLTAAGPRQRIFTWTLDEVRATEEIRRAVGDAITAEEWEHYLPMLPYAPSPRLR